MKGIMETEGQDLHAGDVIITKKENPSTGFGRTMEEEVEEAQLEVVHGREIWLENDHDQDLLDVNEASIFYSEFPPFPDFPCMSSSSSSSSTPVPVKAMTSSSSSSSSAASWAVLMSETEEDEEKKQHYHHHRHNNHNNNRHEPVGATTLAALSSTASMEFSEQQEPNIDCMDMMETFGYMDLLETDEFLDPSSIFQSDQSAIEDFQQEMIMNSHEDQKEHAEIGNNNVNVSTTTAQEEIMNEHELMMAQPKIDNNNEGDRKEPAVSDDMATVFLEWLRSNRETVSAEDLRSVKIKKATIECAARRLGGGKEAMKQLLKLVLEWVQMNHLQKTRIRDQSPSISPFQDFPFQNAPTANPNPNPDPKINHEPSNPCFGQSTPWMPQPPPAFEPVVVSPQPPPPAAAYPSPMVGFMGEPFANGSGYTTVPPPTDNYNMVDSAQTWHSSQFGLASPYAPFPDNNNNLQPTLASPHAQAFAGYGSSHSQYLYNQYYQEGNNSGHGDRLLRLGSSATKEARKKRMARQRRLLTHHRHHNHHHTHHHNQHQNQCVDQHERLAVAENCTTQPQQANLGNWVYWPPAVPSPTPPLIPGIPAEAPPLHAVDHQAAPAAQQNYQGRISSERRQGWKPEKNLRFLLQKVLKQSDVGSLGRIVLPKKEAETHLPELEARDGISIPMEDIGTSRVWNMRYRYWPNNKSRMYLLENTGEFVRANGLQEGDFIVIYSDIKCGKYMIRGVKVRQQGPKSENKRPGKSQRNKHISSPAGANNGSSSSHKKQ